MDYESTTQVRTNDVTPQYDFCAMYFESMHSFMINLTTTAVVFGIVALVSNSLFLFTVVKNPHLRQTPVRVYLVSLALIDTCVSVSYTSMALRWLFDSVHNIYSFNVHLLLFIRFPFQLMSSLLIVLVTFERYRAICQPMAHYNSTQKNAKYFFWCCEVKSVIAVAVTGAVIALALFFEYWKPEEHACLEDASVVAFVRRLPTRMHVTISDSIYIINIFMAMLDFVTIITSVSLSVMIYRKLGKVPKKGSVNGGKRYAREQKNMTRMVVANTLVFCLFVLLQDICSCIYLTFEASYTYESIKAYLHLLFILTLLNSGANPIIYNVFGSVYRNAFIKSFPCLVFASKWAGISFTERSSTSFETQISTLQRFNIEEEGQ